MYRHHQTILLKFFKLNLQPPRAKGFKYQLYVINATRYLLARLIGAKWTAVLTSKKKDAQVTERRFLENNNIEL